MDHILYFITIVIVVVTHTHGDYVPALQDILEKEFMQTVKSGAHTVNIETAEDSINILGVLGI